MTPGLPSGVSFQRRVIGICYALSAPALAIVLAILFALLELTPESWTRFFWIVAVYAVVISPLSMWLQGSYIRPVRAWLEADGGDARPAFAAVMVLPLRVGVFGGLSWVLPCALVSLAMALVADEWGLGQWSVMVVAGSAAGFVMGNFTLFLVKRSVESVRNALAAELPDPEERRSLISPTTLRAKLVFTVAGLTIVPVLFAVLLAQSRTRADLARFATVWQRGVVDAAAPRLGGAAGARELAAAAEGLPDLIDLAVLDLGASPDSAVEARGVPAEGVLEPHAVALLRERLAEGVEVGDSAGLASNQVFAWRRLDARNVLVARTPRASLGSARGFLPLASLLLLVVATATALGLAFLLAADVSRSTSALRAEAERLASGDLRSGRALESEDELGDLSRSFEGMAGSLRDTVRSVAAAADRVESAAREMAQTSSDVSSVTASQVEGIQQATSSMWAINEQAQGIADSSAALNASVEESSSTILELGAAGEELNETASVLSAKVDEVSSSIEQTVRSVRQVVENTEALSEASLETSTSMEEMATSMREVDSSAEQTGRQSAQVVERAESGQTKVRQTIEGMEAIRDATETAESVIRSLGERTVEIGAIVDVIDDVADETNLLALNAAIIAAQAGEHGRAFSVVADEIKDLADRVLASTKEIGGLIGAVQQESSRATGAIERGSESVASGVDLSAEAGLSLEEITAASRDSGMRMSSIVSAVREQAKAAGHVVELMERVRSGVDEIRSAAAEQDRGNEVVHRSAQAMREVAQQVRGTTEEQARGSRRIRESAEEVREAVEQINGALQEQSAACRSALSVLEEVQRRTRSNETSARKMDEATELLLRQARDLREDVHRFEL